MKFPFFASFIVFIIWLQYEIKKSNKKKNQATKDFWAKENESNHVRKQPIDQLPYIKLSDALIPIDLIDDELLLSDNPVYDAIQCLQELKEEKILNLTGISNTDLKLTYGTANITPLSEYDDNYTKMSSALYTVAEYLLQNGHTKKAADLMEFLFETGSDLTGCYRILYQYYMENNLTEKIDSLRERAEGLQTPMKNAIIRTLWGAEDAMS